MNKTQLIRLQSGKDIISEYAELGEELVQLFNPVAIEMVPRGEKLILFMEPWVPSQILLENSVILSRKDILFASELQPQVIENYRNMVIKVLDGNGGLKVLKEGMDKDMEEDYGDIHILEGLDMDGGTLQ